MTSAPKLTANHEVSDASTDDEFVQHSSGIVFQVICSANCRMRSSIKVAPGLVT